MKSSPWLWIAGGLGVAWLLSRTQTAQNLSAEGIDVVTATVSGWKSVQQGPHWVPIINGIEQQYGLPPDLLARIAYQESHFRPEFIDGTKPSDAGALGLMQLMPQYFTSVQRAAPFSEQDTLDQINQAALLLQSLYSQFNDWGLALMAYNDGAGNIRQYLAGHRSLPQQTVNYFTSVTADVPVATNVQLA